MESKVCGKCKVEKPVKEFGKDKQTKSGLNCRCKKCNAEYQRIYWIKNPGKHKESDRIYRIKNPEKLKERVRQYLIKNPEKRKKYNRRSNKHRRLNPVCRLNEAISKGIGQSLKLGKGGRHWELLLPYTLQEFILYFESLFTHGMTWENYGKKGWEIHHILPKSWWKFESYNDREFKQCWALCNLQPLWSKDNAIKGNRVKYL